MPKYIQKPVTVEAVPAREVIEAHRADWQRAPAWFRTVYDQGGVVVDETSITMTTAEGTVRAGVDDYIVSDGGSVRLVKASTFAGAYEAVREVDETAERPARVAHKTYADAVTVKKTER